MRAKSCGEVHIHLGAHRTGSTAFQMTLSTNAAAIGAQGFGLGFPGRGGVPNGQLKLYLEHEAVSDEKLFDAQVSDGRAAIFPIVANASQRQSILSEENLIGGMISFHKGEFYPYAREKMTLLREVVLPANIGNVLLLIRSYDTLFESAFRKRAEAMVMPNYTKVRGRQTNFVGGWPKLVDDIRETLRPKNLIVVPYRRKRDDLALLKWLCPEIDVSQLEPNTGYTNESLSDSALFEIQRRRYFGEHLNWDEKQRIRKAYADKVADRPFAKLLPEQARVLSDRYLADIETLRHHTGITFVEG